MDAEEEDEDEDEDLEGADVSTQSEAEANQSANSTAVDSGTEKMEEGNEDKENTSLISGGADNSLTWNIVYETVVMWALRVRLEPTNQLTVQQSTPVLKRWRKETKIKKTQV